MKETLFLKMINLVLHAFQVCGNIPSWKKTMWVSIDGTWTKIYRVYRDDFKEVFKK